MKTTIPIRTPDAPGSSCRSLGGKRSPIRTAAALAVLSAIGIAVAGVNKVLLIGLDGTRPDALTASNSPCLDSLMAEGTYSLDALTVPPTWSGPGWSSILTGVWWTKHGVVDNSFVGSRFDAYPCVFKRIKEFDSSLKCASIVNKQSINEIIVEGVDYEAQSLSDAEVARLAVDYLASNDPDVLFVQFKETDYTGHATGYDPMNPEYLVKIEAIDGYIRGILRAIRNRPSAGSENWLILAAADHGGLNRTHGGGSLQERNIFFIASGPGVPVRNLSRNTASLPAPAGALRFDGVSNYAAIADQPLFQFGATQDFTVEFMVRTPGWSGTPTLVGNKNRRAGPNLGFTIACVENGRWKANLADGISEAELVGERIDDGRWHHLAASYDRDGRFFMLQDGVALNSRPISHIGSIDSGLNTGIGQDGSLRYPAFFPGLMAELRIWKCALPESLVAAWAGRPLEAGHPLYGNLIGYWKMDADSGNTAEDLAPNGNPLTVQGAPPAWIASADTDSVRIMDYSHTPRIVDVSPTLLAYLGIPVDPAWQLDGSAIGIPPVAGVVSGTLKSDAVLAAPGPWRITSGVVVPAGVTLAVEAGTTLHFEPNAGIRVERKGRLMAAGTDDSRITLTRVPGFPFSWNGIAFDSTLEDNALSHVDIMAGDGRNEILFVRASRLRIDHATWSNTAKTVIEAQHPSLDVRNSIFPVVDGSEVIHGAGLRDREYLILGANRFGSTSGYNDVIDFSDCRRPGPVLEVYDNTFTGGGDDALDLDGCDAHIEGNVFMNFHKANGSSSTSNALATGISDGYAPTLVVARNVFMDNDHAVLLKEGSFMRAENNVFVSSVYGAVNFGEWPDRSVDPGLGAVFDGNIFWNNGSALENRFAPQGKKDPEITMNRCMVSTDLHSLGTGNLDADPRFVDPAGDFRLLPDSPARKTGPNGLDMGAAVPAGASVSGEPDSVSDNSSAMLTVGGPGIAFYKFSLNSPDGPWYGDFSRETDPVIRLAGLENGGSYSVYVRGQNSAARWQANPEYAVSKSWNVVLSPNGIPQPDSPDMPKSFALRQNTPNPFNPVTEIRYDLPEASTVSLKIFDSRGREVADLASGPGAAGRHRVVWNAENLPSGVYIARFEAGDFIRTVKMILVK
jgi:hypothetical protein